jgi:hypothetical protein
VKKLIALLLVAAFICASTIGCSNATTPAKSGTTTPDAKKDGK